MRCGCPDCGTWMVHSEGPGLGCVCPACGARCTACLGTNTVIRYSIPNDVANAQVIIFDLQGTMLSQIPISPSDDNVTLNGTEFPAGMYIYSLIADGKVVATKRMIVVK